MNHTISRTLVILATLALAACTSLQQAHTDIATLHASFESLVAGKIGAGELTTADLQNAKSRFEEHLAATGNPYDKVGVQCTTQLLAYFPTLQATFGPAVPAPPSVPVIGFFSGVAALQIADEDTHARVAAKEALIRNGFPAEVTIACSPLTDVIGRALLHGGTGVGGK